MVHNDSMGDGRTVRYNRYTAAGCTGTWGGSAEVLPRTVNYSAAYPAVSVDQNDKPYVTWSQSLAARISPFPPCGSSKCAANTHCYTLGKICIPDYGQHFSRRKSGVFGKGNWTSPFEISTGIKGNNFAHHGAIFALSSTSVHAVWMHGDPSRNIYYAQYDGTKWSKPEFTGIGAHMADVAVDAKEVHAFSNNARYSSRPVSPMSGAKWASVTKLGGASVINFVRLKLASSGRLHAVWNDGYRIRYSMTDAAGKWLASKYISPSGQSAHEPWVDVDPTGTAHIIWTECTKPACKDEHGAVYYLKTRYSEIP